MVIITISLSLPNHSQDAVSEAQSDAAAERKRFTQLAQEERERCSQEAKACQERLERAEGELRQRERAASDARLGHEEAVRKIQISAQVCHAAFSLSFRRAVIGRRLVL